MNIAGIGTLRPLVVIAIAVTVGAGGCGGDDASSDAPATTMSSARASGDESAIKETYATFVERFYAADPRACDVMTKRTQTFFATKFGKGDGKTCEANISAIGAKEFSPNRPFLVTIKVRGDVAVAGAKNKTSSVYKVFFSKVGGEWKLDSRG